MNILIRYLHELHASYGEETCTCFSVTWIRRAITIWWLQ